MNDRNTHSDARLEATNKVNRSVYPQGRVNDQVQVARRGSDALLQAGAPLVPGSGSR